MYGSIFDGGQEGKGKKMKSHYPAVEDEDGNIIIGGGDGLKYKNRTVLEAGGDKTEYANRTVLKEDQGATPKSGPKPIYKNKTVAQTGRDETEYRNRSVLPAEGSQPREYYKLAPGEEENPMAHMTSTPQTPNMKTTTVAKPRQGSVVEYDFDEEASPRKKKRW